MVMLKKEAEADNIKSYPRNKNYKNLNNKDLSTVAIFLLFKEYRYSEVTECLFKIINRKVMINTKIKMEKK